ncbi:MAG: DUF4040 domain-containing protein [Opitutales bacterium]|nr:DUF4040 domain-containing protein [Opitutales bacterium]
MAGADILFDLLLAAFLVLLAWRALAAPQLYQAAIFFIAFGLAMALAWTRMGAPDVALAEAAIGAGLLGVLLIDSLAAFTRGRRSGEAKTKADSPADGPAKVRRMPRAPIVFAFAAGIVFTAAWTIAVLRMPDGGGLTAAADAAMGESGVAHPVTAVLLNFRGYDTWLEVGVLLLAMLGIFCAVGKTGFERERRPGDTDPLINWLVRALVPLMVLVSGYILWLGKTAPGGAFQSGVILGAAGILLRIAGFRAFGLLPVWAWKAGLVFGFAVFLAIGTAALPAGRAFLEYPAETAGAWILIVEAACALSIGFTLLAFFVCLNAASERGAGGEGEHRTMN